MKTIIIPIKTGTRKFCDDIESIGLIKLKRDNTDKATEIKYVKGVSEKPETVNYKTHIWLYEENSLGMLTGRITHHRINLSDKGEQILKDNKIAYEVEKDI